VLRERIDESTRILECLLSVACFQSIQPCEAFLFLLGGNYSVDLTRRQFFDRSCLPDDRQGFLPHILRFCTFMEQNGRLKAFHALGVTIDRVIGD
jgi:hypothetical protein